MRFSKKYKIGYIDSIDVEYRIHENSSMQSKEYLGKVFESFLITLNKNYGYERHNNKIIVQHINKYTIGMYRLGIIHIKYLSKNFYYNKDLKSMIYLILGIFRVKVNQIK